ncbi:hypothetical protein Q3Y58_19250 [Pseudovibrio sp. SPO723]|nr:hypothetical protein [Pseudovibrio sp. SPO723]MDX5595709.1 hypothetical protein [Pseudovibrio sp. SPO723]
MLGRFGHGMSHGRDFFIRQQARAVLAEGRDQVSLKRLKAEKAAVRKLAAAPFVEAIKKDNVLESILWNAGVLRNEPNAASILRQGVYEGARAFSAEAIPVLRVLGACDEATPKLYLNDKDSLRANCKEVDMASLATFVFQLDVRSPKQSSEWSL